ncbi:hypothetical protein MOV08_42210 [Streptomyces yunnanensis]|uniref:Polyketide cyclase / dehydrase and lipid transport n=1 Tax=Streptomyces yunnanensis TaxID=156453 RepID=A0ABY8AJR2_9ACTN|nr:hypothetical protein [Streptomyces yunnanensis]WEB45264.1 hypothetical protein MOV08_42210 [Streptomyces yunnanensis]
MASTSVSRVVHASPEAVWNLIGGFHSLPGRPEAAEVQWSGRFVPEGVSDEEAEALFAGIYRDGLDALAAAIETR